MSSGEGGRRHALRAKNSCRGHHHGVNTTLRGHVGQKSPVGVLLAGLENITYGKAKLYYIHGEGYGEHIDFVCTGQGGPYALSIAKFLLDEDENVEENARRIAYIISWIAEDVDTAVGGIPDVPIIKDRKEPKEEEIVERLNENTVKEILEKVKEDKEKLPSILGFEKKGITSKSSSVIDARRALKHAHLSDTLPNVTFHCLLTRHRFLNIV